MLAAQGIATAHRDSGVPAVVLHCTMHSYRAADKITDEWRKLLGVTTVRHQQHVAVDIKNLQPKHPIMKGFGEEKQARKKELVKRFKNNQKDIIHKLDLTNIKISANSEKLNINQQISLKDMSFENIGNTKDSKDYKTVLKDTFDKAFKSVKNKVLSGNVGNTLDKIKTIDEEKIKEKIKKELYENKDKVKDKLKKLLKKN